MEFLDGFISPRAAQIAFNGFTLGLLLPTMVALVINNRSWTVFELVIGLIFAVSLGLLISNVIIYLYLIGVLHGRH